MYTNPYNIAATLKKVLEKKAPELNALVKTYQSNRELTVLTGSRKVIPVSLYPVVEIEASDGSNQWGTTRAQRPTYSFKFTLTLKCEKEELGLEYICTLTTALVRILTAPQNIQLPVEGERRWDSDGNVVDTYILDGLADNVSYLISKDGTSRRSEFNLWIKIHEPYPDVNFEKGSVVEKQVAP